MQYLSAAASLRLKYVCDRDSEMQNLEICMSGKCIYFLGGSGKSCHYSIYINYQNSESKTWN